MRVHAHMCACRVCARVCVCVHMIWRMRTGKCVTVCAFVRARACLCLFECGARSVCVLACVRARVGVAAYGRRASLLRNSTKLGSYWSWCAYLRVRARVRA